jgi:hypothetical protein
VHTLFVVCLFIKVFTRAFISELAQRQRRLLSSGGGGGASARSCAPKPVVRGHPSDCDWWTHVTKQY